MKRTYSVAEVPNAIDILRKAGYAYFRDPQSGEESFVVRLTPAFYPRFHLYVDSQNDRVTFNLHLDQKQPSYGSGTKHSGEYEGPVIEKEMSRIDSWVRAGVRQAQKDTSEHDIDHRNKSQQIRQAETLKRWWKNIFG